MGDQALFLLFQNTTLVNLLGASFAVARVCREFRAQAYLLALRDVLWGKACSICIRCSPPGWVHLVEDRDGKPVQQGIPDFVAFSCALA